MAGDSDFNDIVGTHSTPRSARTGRAGIPSNIAYAEDPKEGEAGEAKAKDASMWAVHGTNFFPCDESVGKLPPGQYEVLKSQTGLFFQRKLAKFDELIALPDSASDRVFKNILDFWQKEEHFRKFGYLWKRGILLWGPPGSGKTCTIQMLSQAIIKMGGISVYVNQPSVTAQGLHIFRKIEPNRPCIVLLEDIDAMLHEHPEHEILALLDGELQIDNVVFIATTNYPERLDRRIANRPSRFDIVQKVGMPDEAARKVYLLHKNERLNNAMLECLPCGGKGNKVTINECTLCIKGKITKISETEGNSTIDCETCAGNGKVTHTTECVTCKGKGQLPEISSWLEETKDFSIAHIKELIVSVEIFEVPIALAAKRLRAMSNRPKSTDANEADSSGQYM